MNATSRPNVLMLTHRVPFPPNRGDRIRSYHLLKFLAENRNVYLACLADESTPAKSMEMLESLCTKVAVAPVGRSRWWKAARAVGLGRSATEGLFESKQLRRTIRKWAADVEFDCVVVFCSSMFQYATVPELASRTVVVDLVDVDSQKWFDYAESAQGLKRHLFALEGRRVRKLERRIAADATAVTVVSDAEAELFRRVCPNEKTVGVTNGVDLDYFAPVVESSALRDLRCVFVGVLDYWANVEGLRWFCSEVWPAVRAQFPSAQFDIVGRRPGPAVEKLGEIPGVQVVGEVPDVRPYVARAALVVAPLRVARGIQNKVLEAMAMAKPVVASAEALEGLQVRPGQEVVRACGAGEWKSEIGCLLEGASARAWLSSHARRYVEANHSWNACLSRFDELIGSTENSVEDGARSNICDETTVSTAAAARATLETSATDYESRLKYHGSKRRRVSEDR